MATEYVYLARDAAVFGIARYEVVKRTPLRVVVMSGSGRNRWKRTLPADECFGTAEAALAAAYAHRDAEIASCEHRIAHLKARTYTVMQES